MAALEMCTCPRATANTILRDAAGKTDPPIHFDEHARTCPNRSVILEAFLAQTAAKLQKTHEHLGKAGQEIRRSHGIAKEMFTEDRMKELPSGSKALGAMADWYASDACKELEGGGSV